MAIGIIIQARMGSSRLPGKVLEVIEGKPMLWHIIQRLKHVKLADELIVATSDNQNDKPVAELAQSCGIKTFRGSEDDVLDRFYRTATEFQFDHIVRATGDNPLVDPEETDRLIDFHLKTAADYSSNKSEIDSGLPIGVGVEIFTFVALEKSWREGKRADYREHVDEYILQNQDIFKVKTLNAPANKYAPDLRLTVDTEDDLRVISDIYRYFYEKEKIISVDKAIKYMFEQKQVKQ